MRRYSKPILFVILVALLATPSIMRRMGPRAAAADIPPGGDVRERYGFRLVESAREAGIDFTHASPTLDPRLSHIMQIVASMGASVSIADVDADGRPDI